MKQKVIPGGEIDAVTEEELKALLAAEFRSEVVERTVAPFAFPVKLDANGNGQADLYQCPPGMEFRLARITVEAQGYTYAAMFKNAAGGVTILRGDRTIDGFNLAAGLPNVWTGGSGSAPRYRNGQVIALAVVGGPPNAIIMGQLEGDELPDRVKGSA